MKKIAVIGAGISGLTLAFHLKNKAEITIFEKSRGVGGRLATRYTDTHEFDHGAQYFTARTDEFRQFLAPFIKQGIVQEWHPKVLTLHKSCKPYKRDYFEPHYVAVPRMNSLCKAIGQSLDIKLNTHITHLIKNQNKWQLHTTQKEIFEEFDWVISAVPAPQASQIMPKDFYGYPNLQTIEMTGCYSLMIGLRESTIFPFEAAIVQESPIGWIAINSTKPGRSGAVSLLAQTTNDWSKLHLEDELESVQTHLLQELEEILKIDLFNAHSISLHRWRYANVEHALGENYLLDEAQNLAACGDWCLKGRVESAFLSGFRLAQAWKIKNNSLIEK